MSQQADQIRFQGIIQASRYDAVDSGKQFLGVALECDDGKVWILDYEEHSPFHAFAGCAVIVSGESCHPRGQCLIGWKGAKELGHFRVSSLRPVERTRATALAEVGAGYALRGRFEFVQDDASQPALVFVADRGERFVVVNDPVGIRMESNMEVWAYPVKPSFTNHRSLGRWLWIVCPCSAADLWAWRERHS